MARGVCQGHEGLRIIGAAGMSIRRQLETLEKKMQPWIVAPPPPNAPDDEHWWRDDPQFERLIRGLLSILRHAKVLANQGDEEAAAFVYIQRLGRAGGSLYYRNPQLLAAVAFEKRIPLDLLEEVADAMVRLGQGSDPRTVLHSTPLLPTGKALAAVAMAEQILAGKPLDVDPVEYRRQILEGQPILEGMAP
jgi:hypothetical protein